MATEVKDPSQTDVTKAVNAVGADLKDPFSSTSYRKKADEATTAGQKATTELGNIYTKRSEETQPFIEKGERALKAQEDLQPPKLQDLPKYERKPIDAEEAKNTYSTLMAFAFIGGALSRQPMQAALANMTAIMKGTMEGDANRVKKETDEFEKNYKSAKQQRDSQLEEYKLAIDKNKGNLQGTLDSVKLVGLKYGDQISAKLAEQGNYKDLTKHYETLAKQSQTAEQQQKQFLLNIRRQEAVEKRENQRHSETLARMGSKAPDFQDEQGNFYKYTDKGFEKVESPEGAKLSKIGGKGAQTTKGGAINSRLAYTIAENMGQATADLVNVASMPENTVLGNFAGMTGKSGDKLSSALRNSFTREITQDDARMMQQVVAGLETGMSRTLGGGYASSSTKAIMDQYTKQLPQAGDSPIVTATFLARIKQELGIVADNFHTHPGAGEAQIKQVDGYMKEINQAVPFSVKDVINAQRQDRGTLSKESTNLLNITPSINLPQSRVPTEASAPDIQNQANQAFGSYDPAKYDYRVNPDTGKIQRKAKE